MQKLLSEQKSFEKISDYALMSVNNQFVKPLIKTSSSCRVIVRIPSVEPEEKNFEKIFEDKKPLRPSSAPRPQRNLVGCNQSFVNVNVRKKSVVAKRPKNEKLEDWLFIYQKYLTQTQGTFVRFQMHNDKPLPNPQINEHKRAALRLRKLKRVNVRNNKENNFNN